MIFYLQSSKSGRVFLDDKEPEPENMIRAITADSWKAARDSLVSEFDHRYVEGLTYKEGYGYEHN